MQVASMIFSIVATQPRVHRSPRVEMKLIFRISAT